MLDTTDVRYVLLHPLDASLAFWVHLPCVKSCKQERPKQTRATDILHILATQPNFFPHCFKHVITRYVPLMVDQQDPVGTERSHCMELHEGKTSSRRCVMSWVAP